MPEQPVSPHKSFVLLCILGMTLMTSGFPHPRLPLRHDDSAEAKHSDWNVLFLSISVRDCRIQTMSAPSLRAAADSKSQLMREAWLFDPDSTATSMEPAWPVEWPSQEAGTVKRNMVVADDAAFREKSKLLTSIERQKWLNSYMQKLLVVNSS
uniref:Tuberoinfundibular peptide of 39 residues n=1 Tax=Echeneis naucrates TaxID=173247 RepID=A0A665TV76_ECHNA